MKDYEVWIESDSATLSTAAGIRWQKEKGLIGKGAELLHKFSAASPEEANAIYHLRMGWEPYRPVGDPALCPNNCGSYYYPNGSGVCPNCGEINE